MDMSVTDPCNQSKADCHAQEGQPISLEVTGGYLYCKMCGRRLKNEESKAAGMGPTCRRRYIEQTNRRKLF